MQPRLSAGRPASVAYGERGSGLFIGMILNTPTLPRGPAAHQRPIQSVLVAFIGMSEASAPGPTAGIDHRRITHLPLPIARVCPDLCPEVWVWSGFRAGKLWVVSGLGH